MLYARSTTNRILSKQNNKSILVFYIDEREAHKFVKCTQNVKIESPWSRLLKSKGYAVMNILKEGMQQELYNENNQLEKYY